MAQYDIVFVRNVDGAGTAFSEFVLSKPSEINMFLTQNPTTGVLSWELLSNMGGVEAVNLTVNTARTTAAKTTEETVTFKNGVVYMVNFVNGTSVSAATLNGVNIRLGDTNVSTTTLSTGASPVVVPMRYNSETNSLHIFGSHRTSDAIEDFCMRWQNSVIAGTGITRYKMVMEGHDGRFYPLAIGDNITVDGKSISTVKFKLNSPILWYLTTTALAENAVFTTLYSELYTTGDAVQRNFNKQSGWVANKAVYLVGTIDGDGYFILDNSTSQAYMTQALPTTADGKVYLLLGYMNDTTTAFRLVLDRIAYEFKGGKIRVYETAIQAGDIPLNDKGGWVYNPSNDLLYSSRQNIITHVSVGAAELVRDSAFQVIHQASQYAEILIGTTEGGDYVELNNLTVSQKDTLTGYRGLTAHTFDWDTKAFPYPNTVVAGFRGALKDSLEYSFAELFPNDKDVLPGLRILYTSDGNDGYYRFASLFRETQQDAAFEITNYYPGVMPVLRLWHSDTGQYLQFTHNGSGSAIESNELIHIIGVGGILMYTGGVTTYVRDAGLGIDTPSPEALLHIGAGYAGKPPIKLTQGTNLTTPEAGAVEWDGTRLFITNSTRQTLAYLKDIGLRASQTAVINATAHLAPTVIHGDSVGSSTILANTFVAGDVLTRKLAGVYNTAASTQNITVRVLLNTTVLISITGNLPASANAWSWIGDVNLTIKTTGASGKSLLTGAFFMESRSLGYSVMIPLTVTTEIDIDTTQSNTIIVDAQWANSGNSLKSIHSNLKLERVN
jgi:hypothetical protein